LVMNLVILVLVQVEDRPDLTLRHLLTTLSWLPPTLEFLQHAGPGSNYRGTLVDGTEIDSSYQRYEPSTFPMRGVIKGWSEALQLMPVGSRWQIFVPSQLAYGERGNGRNIGPNSTLIFEVELLSIQSGGAEAKAKGSL